MIDFFDEDFPLTKKQKEAAKASAAASPEDKESLPENAPAAAEKSIGGSAVFNKAEEHVPEADDAVGQTADFTLNAPAAAESVPIHEENDSKERQETSAQQEAAPTQPENGSYAQKAKEVLAQPESIPYTQDTTAAAPGPVERQAEDQEADEIFIDESQDVPAPQEQAAGGETVTYEPVENEAEASETHAVSAGINAPEAALPSEEPASSGEAAAMQPDCQEAAPPGKEGIAPSESDGISHCASEQPDDPQESCADTSGAKPAEAAEAEQPEVPNEDVLTDRMVKVKGALDDAEEALRAELREIVEKLDNMEKAVDAMESARSDESEDTGFSYEYDERYFAEEETPAYKYPELYRKSEHYDYYDDEEPYEESRTPPRKPAASANTGVKRIPRRDTSARDAIMKRNAKTLIKVGTAAAATAAAVKLLGKKGK